MDNLGAFSIRALRQILFFPVIQSNVNVTTSSTHLLDTSWLLKKNEQVSIFGNVYLLSFAYVMCWKGPYIDYCILQIT